MHRFVRARSINSSPRPLVTAFTMQSVKPLAISMETAGGMASSHGSQKFTGTVIYRYTHVMESQPNWHSSTMTTKRIMVKGF